jgi:hypothetical protein
MDMTRPSFVLTSIPLCSNYSPTPPRMEIRFFSTLILSPAYFNKANKFDRCSCHLEGGQGTAVRTKS